MLGIADEGMWTFNNPPTKALKEKYGFELTKAWLDHVRLSSVRFGGASASFVSPDGLVMTNHHVGARAIQNLSTKEKDYVKNGFYAKTRAEEPKCPDMDLRVLQDIQDVTKQVTKALKPEMTPAQLAEAERAATASIEKECNTKTGLTCQVVKLYSGGMYHLYKYKKYTDVRLVFAPEFDIAFFGGDPDNFTYPRYDLDVSFFRVYENDKPIHSKHYLKWSQEPVKEGDLLFLSGNPGSTGRLLTLAQLEFLRDHNYPERLASLKRQQALLKQFSEKGPEQKRIAQGQLFGIENTLKAITGYQSGLLNQATMAKKAAAEKELREQIAKNPSLQKEFGAAWDEIAQAQKVAAGLDRSHNFFSTGSGFRTAYFRHARTLVRLAEESKKPNDKRLPEFRESNLPTLMRTLTSTAPIYDELEIVTFADSLAEMKEKLGADHELVKQVLGSRSPEEVARELISGSKLKDPAVRKTLADGGQTAVGQTDDPMIKLAKLVDPVSRSIRDQFEKEVTAVETKNGALISRALFKLRGTAISPDATGTLRLSFGTVKGYMEDGKKIDFQTTLRGLYARAEEHGSQPPYQLPPSFIEKKSALNLDTSFNFVSTGDIIGGNSGSPAINRKGELIGIAFDGNIQSLPNRFVYTDEQARSVMVSPEAITETLSKVYGAQALADELRPGTKE
jgi:hypothetical protein